MLYLRTVPKETLAVKIWWISIKGKLAKNILANSAHLKIQFKAQRTCVCVWCVEMAIFTFSVEAMIRGYHEYTYLGKP